MNLDLTMSKYTCTCDSCESGHPDHAVRLKVIELTDTVMVSEYNDYLNLVIYLPTGHRNMLYYRGKLMTDWTDGFGTRTEFEFEENIYSMDQTIEEHEQFMTNKLFFQAPVMDIWHKYMQPNESMREVLDQAVHHKDFDTVQKSCDAELPEDMIQEFKNLLS